MRSFLPEVTALLFSTSLLAGECSRVLDYDLRLLADQSEVNLCEAYPGKVLLVVNTASKCAFTGQYEGLEALFDEYRERGLVVLGFPSNDFGAQEPGSEQEIQNFCRSTYSVRFPMFAKTSVRGETAAPFWKNLATVSGTVPKWNFHKYLIDRDGHFVAEFSSLTQPQSLRLREQIEALLQE
jgi:glutathione peroxidase